MTTLAEKILSRLAFCARISSEICILDKQIAILGNLPKDIPAEFWQAAMVACGTLAAQRAAKEKELLESILSADEIPS